MIMDKSTFHLNNTTLTSFEMSELVPFMYRETIPSDDFKGSSNAFIRAMPLVRPVMHKLDLYTRFYYVPYRLLSKDLRKMVTKPLEDVKFMSLFDYLVSRNELDRLEDIFARNNKNLLSYFGISSSRQSLHPEQAKKISMLPFMAYYLIYNYYYLDPILNGDVYQDEFDIDTFKDFDLLEVRNVNRYNDYFTSAKPTTQYGSEVGLDLDSNGSIKVSEMRLAERLQVWYERLLHNFEHRYNETLRGFYGVSPRDETLQRPLYLGGDKQMLNIMDVDTTAQFNNEPIASPAGKSLTSSNGNNWDCFCTEHGLILGLAHILPRQSYIAGIPAEFTRLSSADLHNPLFNNIGFQELKESELDANRVGVFGYKERYAEFKECKDIIASDMIHDSQWHLGLDIRNANLNAGFIRSFAQNDAFATSDNAQKMVLNPTSFLYFYIFIGLNADGLTFSQSYRLSFYSLSDDELKSHENDLKLLSPSVKWKSYLFVFPVSRLHSDRSLEPEEVSMTDLFELTINSQIYDGINVFYYPSSFNESLYKGIWYSYLQGTRIPDTIAVNHTIKTFNFGSEFKTLQQIYTEDYDLSKFTGFSFDNPDRYEIFDASADASGGYYITPNPPKDIDMSHNHFIGMFYNTTTALRPLPKRVNTMYY